MPKFYVQKRRQMDFGIEIEAESEEAALIVAKNLPEEDFNDEGCDTFWEVEEFEDE